MNFENDVTSTNSKANKWLCNDFKYRSKNIIVFNFFNRIKFVFHELCSLMLTSLINVFYRDIFVCFYKYLKSFLIFIISWKNHVVFDFISKYVYDIENIKIFTFDKFATRTKHFENQRNVVWICNSINISMFNINIVEYFDIISKR